jgi:hypothetical protein
MEERRCAIKTIADSLNVVVHVERRPGRRYISEVLFINRYDPDADLFDYGAVFLAKPLRSPTRRPMAERKYYVFMTFGRAMKRKERRPPVTN